MWGEGGRPPGGSEDHPFVLLFGHTQNAVLSRPQVDHQVEVLSLQTLKLFIKTIDINCGLDILGLMKLAAPVVQKVIVFMSAHYLLG